MLCTAEKLTRTCYFKYSLSANWEIPKQLYGERIHLNHCQVQLNHSANKSELDQFYDFPNEVSCSMLLVYFEKFSLFILMSFPLKHRNTQKWSILLIFLLTFSVSIHSLWSCMVLLFAASHPLNFLKLTREREWCTHLYLLGFEDECTFHNIELYFYL